MAPRDGPVQRGDAVTVAIARKEYLLFVDVVGEVGIGFGVIVVVVHFHFIF